MPDLRRSLCIVFAVIAVMLSGCGRSKPPANTVVMLIENSPNSLDPRVGTDAVAERVDALIFDSLVQRNNHFGLDPDLALSWQTPNPLTYVFHLRSGVYFQDGRPLTSRDVKWTLDSVLNGTIISIKAGAYKNIAGIDAPDPATVIIHLSQPDPGLLWNLCSDAIGIVPYGSGRDFWQHPIGSGPYRLVSQAVDRNVILVRSQNYWGAKPHIARIRFNVVPDATTRALELEKGSADVAVNALSPDMVEALRHRSNLVVEDGPGSEIEFLVFNLRAPYLKDLRVRRAIAMAINRPLIIHSLMRNLAHPANSLLPAHHWAWTNDVQQYTYDPAAANALLDHAGYKRGAGGIRFHIGLKTSTDETTRLLSVALQQQLARIGIALDLRSYEFATFYSDLTRGAFQMAPSRWIGGNEQPDIFRYAFSASSFPPDGGNRGFYNNPQLDALIQDASNTLDQARQRADYAKVQQILARDLPTINLWYMDTVIVHTRRLKGVHTSPSGNFNFLRTAYLAP
ncbi:MAG TPA: ABC transporter substrate-binding protein [Acidobacteriaceae bacterium]|nr:ABC transporter substrate-binding protein [Acidobacteriaceae bacterium]